MNDQQNQKYPAGQLSILTFALLIGLSMLPSVVQAQTPVFKRYTVEDGIPSSEVYDVHQDTKGYMWIATDHGLCRFDGYKFVTYTTSDGLADNVVFRIIEDNRGRIWLPTISKGLCYYENGKFYQHPLNERIIKEARGSWINSLFIDEKDTIWYAYRDVHNKIFRITPDNKLIIDSLPLEGVHYNTAYVRKIGKDGFVCGTTEEIKGRQHPALASWSVDNLFVITNRADEIVDCIQTEDGSTLCSIGNTVVSYKDSRLKEVTGSFTNKTITDLFEDDKKRLWAGSLRAGVFLFENGITQSAPFNFFHGMSISHITQDNEGGYWFSTLEDGVYYMPSFEFKKMNFASADHDERVTAIAPVKDGLLFSTYRGHLYKLNKNGQTSDMVYNKERFHIDDILLHSDNNIYLSNNYQLSPSGKGSRSASIHRNTKIITETPDGGLLLSGANGFKKYLNGKLVLNSDDYGFSERITAVHAGSNGELWFGTLNGLYLFDKGRIEYLSVEDPLLANRITGIAKGPGNTLLLATRGAGLLVKQGDLLRQFTKKHGLPSDLIISMMLENDSVLWLGTNKGLSKLRLDRNCYPHGTENYTINDGLPSNEINEIAKYNGMIWIGTNKGLVYFDPGKISEIYPAPAVYITGVKINDEETTLNPSYLLNADQRNIIIDFFGISFRTRDKTLYRYKLEGLHDDWIETNNLSVQYTNLPAGNYDFKVEARNKDGVWSAQAAAINFHIDKYFYNRWGFRVLILLLVAGLATLISGLIIRFNKARQETKTRIIQSEQKALRSQMNPHFIFNAMNSIQFFIAGNDKKKAAVYLSKFSLLIRSIMQNSRKNLVTLEEELNSAQLYLELEKLRFSEKFDYTIELDGINTSEIMIPSMLIQPYLENAIWDGIMPKESKGHVTLKLKAVNGELRCIIEDNGIGRDKAREISLQRNFDKSDGMQNILERIELLNYTYKSSLRVEVIDLYSENREANGTRIVLHIPTMN